MHTQNITSTWQNILKHFFPVFTIPIAKIFAALPTGWVLCTSRRTVTGIIPFATAFCHRPHDAFHRFFCRAQWSVAELWRLLTILLIKTFSPGGTIHLDLDDTPLHRPGRKVSGVSNWRDPVRSVSSIVYAHGLNMVVLTLRVYPPWACRIHQELQAGCHHRARKEEKNVWSGRDRLYGITVSKRPVMLVISRDPAQKEKDDFFVTTDLTLTPQQAVGGYAGRWSIEDTFKNTRQLLGAQRHQTFKRQGPQRAAAVSLFLYSMVWLWYLQNRHLWKKLPPLPWYRQKCGPSFADALASLRHYIWQARINYMFDKHIAFEKIPELIITALSYAT